MLEACREEDGVIQGWELWTIVILSAFQHFLLPKTGLGVCHYATMIRHQYENI